MTERGGAIIRCRILAPTPDATILNYLNDKEGGTIIFCRILPPPPHDTTITILVTVRGGAIIFCRILAPRNAPPPYPDATILNNLNDREGASLSL